MAPASVKRSRRCCPMLSSSPQRLLPSAGLQLLRPGSYGERQRWKCRMMGFHMWNMLKYGEIISLKSRGFRPDPNMLGVQARAWKKSDVPTFVSMHARALCCVCVPECRTVSCLALIKKQILLLPTLKAQRHTVTQNVPGFHLCSYSCVFRKKNPCAVPKRKIPPKNAVWPRQCPGNWTVRIPSSASGKELGCNISECRDG